MPSIPQYDGLQVSARALPEARQSSIVSPELLGAGAREQMRTGAALQQAGSGLSAIAGKMQDRQNADMLFRAETALQTEYLEYEAGARERKGQSAWGITKDTGAWFDKKVSEHAGNLENDVQRGLFTQKASKLRMQSTGMFSAYETQQRQASIGESAQASIVSSINLAAASAGQAPRGAPTEGGFAQAFDVSEQKLDILKRVQVLSQLNGWTPELRAVKEQEQLTNFHKQIIQARIDKDPSGAKAYFEANKAEIAGSSHDQIDKVLKVGGLKETAQSFADQAGMAGLPEMDALKAAREKFSGEEEAAVVQELKARFGEQTQIRERAQKDAGDAAWKAFSQRGRLSDIPAAALAAMDGRDLVTLRTHARNAAEGHAVKTDFNAWLEARENIVAGRPVNLRGYVNHISSGDLKQLAEMQGKPEKIKEAATLDAQLSNTHDQMGWGEEKDREKKGGFDRAVTDAIDAEQKRVGKSLDYTDRQKVIDRMAISGEVLSGSWYKADPNKQFFEVAGTPDAAKFAPKLTDTDRGAIVERYKKNKGRAPSEAEIAQIYKAWKGL